MNETEVSFLRAMNIVMAKNKFGIMEHLIASFQDAGFRPKLLFDFAFDEHSQAFHDNKIPDRYIQPLDYYDMAHKLTK